MYKTLTTQTLLLGQALDCNSSPTLASRISQVGQRDSVLSTKKIITVIISRNRPLALPCCRWSA